VTPWKAPQVCRPAKARTRIGSVLPLRYYWLEEKWDVESQKRDFASLSITNGLLLPRAILCRAADGTPHAWRKVTKKGDYECDFQFEPPVRSGIRVEKRNARSIAQPVDPAEDWERSEPNQPGYRLFRSWNADYSKPASIRPEWFFWWQFCCDSRRYWCYFSRHGFLHRRLFLLQILRQRFCCVLSQPSNLRGCFVLRSKS
jgi:hypothetical protein